jgi:mRNA guanylyltransferase
LRNSATLEAQTDLHSYYVCEKSDGYRYLLYCSRDEHGKEIHYLIDRKNDYWFVEGLHFPLPGEDLESYHFNTLIDGELVLDKTPDNQFQAKFLVFDCLMLDGNSLMNRTLDKRIAYFKERLFDPYKALYRAYPDELQHVPFIVELKQMQLSYGIEMMFKEVLPKLPHGNDGLIFTCRNTEYKHGTDQHILKWKPETENSVDFRIDLEFPVVQPDEQDKLEGVTEPYLDYDALPRVNLMVHVGDGNDKWYGEMYLVEQQWQDWKAENKPLDDRIAECVMDTQQRWTFMRWRDDKHDANHISTVESVIESITDRVTERDLIVSAKGIRDAWKRRAAAESAQKRKPSEQGGGRPSPSLASQRMKQEE